MSYKVALTPIKIGNVEVPNRIVRTSHGTFPSVTYSQQVIDYHVERAKGGCGLTILQAGSVHPSSLLTKHLFHPDFVASLRNLTAAVRPHGMRLFQQLWHGGNLYPGMDMVPWAVSTIPGFTGIVGEPLNRERIHVLVDAFVSAAARCREGGLDGVEVHAGHGYLFHQFLSPHSNDRSDQWGGTFENRTRFLFDVLREIRRQLPDLALGVRLSASEAPSGISEDDNKILLQKMQSEGLIDYANVSKGDYYRMDTMVSGMHSPVGYELDSAFKSLSVATVPRLVSGRFRTLDEADQVLRDGHADLISMVRAQIADPYLVSKSRNGRANEVRPCIACNQGCWAGSAREGRISCTVNPLIGSEGDLSEASIEPKTSPAKVFVIGGGPAGLEAARMCATRGHKVILAEASAQLGGAVNVAKRAPYLHTLGDITYWLEQEVYRLGVEVRTSSYVEASDVLAESPDAVIVATGSLPRLDGFQPANPGLAAPWAGNPAVLSAEDVLVATGEIGPSAVVFDTVGHIKAIATVEYLIGRGVRTTYVTSNPMLGQAIHLTKRDEAALERIYKMSGLTMLTRYQINDFANGVCSVSPLRTHRIETIDADVLVLVTHNEPLRALYDELEGRVAHLELVGDARSPRDLQFAIAEGHRAARRVPLNRATAPVAHPRVS